MYIKACKNQRLNDAVMDFQEHVYINSPKLCTGTLVLIRLPGGYPSWATPNSPLHCASLGTRPGSAYHRFIQRH